MSVRRGIRAVFIAVALASTIAVPATALAAPSTSPALAGGAVGVQVWPQDGTMVVVVSVTVPEQAKLPATVRVPIPQGVDVQWTGEVLGGDPAADPARPHTIKKGVGGGRYVEFTLKQAHVGQVDSVGPALVVDGTTTSAAVEWIQSVASPETAISVRMPSGATSITVQPAPSGTPETNSQGETLFSATPVSMSVGDTTTVGFSYVQGAPTAGGTGGAGKGRTSLLILGGIALLVALAVSAFFVSRKQVGSAAADDELEDDGIAHSEDGDDESDPASTEEPGDGRVEDDDSWGFDGDSNSGH